MSTPNENGTPSKRARNESSGSQQQTPGREPITPSRRTRSGSQQTPSQQHMRTPNRNRKFHIRFNAMRQKEY